MAGFLLPKIMNKAWSLFELKSFDDDQRTFEGVASTPSTDRMDDIVEPKGAKFKLPVPLMSQHGKGANKDPIGWVTAAKVTDDGIVVKGRFAQVEGPPTLKEDLDRAWSLVKSKLVRGLSIGFRPIEAEPIKGSFGMRFNSWEWLELSTVAIPANADANILQIKSADLESLAALGRERTTVVRLSSTANSPGASGSPLRTVMKPIAEQISAFENKRSANSARMDDIMGKAADEGTTLDAVQTEEYDTLQKDNQAIDDHLVRLRQHEKSLIAKATRVETTAVGGDPEKAAASIRNGGSIVTVKSMAPKGIGVARQAIAMVRAGGNAMVAAEMAKKFWPDAPEVELALKTAVEAGDTTTSGWASQLVPAAQQMNDEFLELLRPQTIIGRIPGIRRIPFNISVPIETASGTAQWVGEGAAKPVTKLTLSSVSLRWAKAAAIVVITKELAKFSRPAAEMVVRDSMVKTLVRFFDTHFISSTAEVSNVSPAGILNGVSPVTASNTTASAFRVDMNNMFNNFTANNVPLSNIVLIMSSTQAVALSLMVTDLGVGLFPSITRDGGTILGFPVVISEAVGNKIIAVNANEILLAEDPGVQVDVSDTASVEMDTEPIVGETSPVTNMVALKSFWQNNLIGIRVEQFITWKVARAGAVEYINANAYVPS